jgi:GNAT superfamily N-acetyltransferase
MMLRIERVSEKTGNLKEIRRLYDASFPDDERIPWKRIFAMLGETRRMYAYYDDALFVGLGYLFIHKNIAYLGYLAVEEELRGRGYGSEILRCILQEMKAYKTVIDIEVVDEKAENYEERLKRKNFYLHSGFEPTGVGYYFYNVDYELLSANGRVSAEEYRNLILEHWGPIAANAVFKKL